MYLEKIDSPADLKKLSLPEMTALAGEMREALFNRLTKIGGHFGPNFGMIEVTIALHVVAGVKLPKNAGEKFPLLGI